MRPMRFDSVRGNEEEKRFLDRQADATRERQWDAIKKVTPGPG